MTTASVVTYKTDSRELETVIGCLNADSVRKIYVVDNSPTDRLRLSATKFENVTYLFGHGNVGYGAGHNIAICEAIKEKADYHLVINADVYFNRGTLAPIERFMDEHTDVGQLIPKVFYPDGRLQYACKLLPSPIHLVIRRFFPLFMPAKSRRRYQLEFTGYDHIMNVPYHHGCFMFFRVDALLKIGLFDERFFLYPEDIDITRRMHKAYKTLFFPDVHIVHAFAAGSGKNMRLMLIHAENMIKYFNKWGWLVDKERHSFNSQLLEEEHYNRLSR